MALKIKHLDNVLWALLILEFVSTIAVLAVTGTEVHIFLDDLEYPQAPSKLAWNVAAVSIYYLTLSWRRLTSAGHYHANLLPGPRSVACHTAKLVEEMEHTAFAMAATRSASGAFLDMDYRHRYIILGLQRPM